MIQNNELRIGNILKDTMTGIWCRVIGITHDEIQVRAMNSNHQPLPGIGWNVIPVEIKETTFQQMGLHQFFELFIENEKVFIQIHDSVALPLPATLHELQNLYFAITKRELL